MSDADTIDDLVVEFPKTVTGCHKEITRLESKISDLEEKNKDLVGKLSAAEEQLEAIEDDEESDGADATDAINAFLDECERTGPLRFDVPQTDRAQRAIVKLHDVVGRNT